MEQTERTEFTENRERPEVVFHIVEHIGVLSESKGWRKELNVVTWNGGPAKLEIRDWDEYHEHMRKGISFTKGELKELRDILNDMDFSKVELPESKSRMGKVETSEQVPF